MSMLSSLYLLLLLATQLNKIVSGHVGLIELNVILQTFQQQNRKLIKHLSLMYLISSATLITDYYFVIIVVVMETNM